MRRSVRLVRRAVAIGMAAVAIIGCGSSDDPTVGAGAGSVCTPSGPRLTISADDLKYDKRCLAAPSGQDLTIVFDNKEPLPHDVAIGEASGNADIFTGDIITGPKTITYTVKPIAPGTYVFWCTVHPSQMVGTFIVK